MAMLASRGVLCMSPDVGLSSPVIILNKEDLPAPFWPIKVIREPVRTGSRITLMGQNGAGKSSLFKMITGELRPTSGDIHRTPRDASIAIARQVMTLDLAEFSVRDYFATA